MWLPLVSTFRRWGPARARSRQRSHATARLAVEALEGRDAPSLLGPAIPPDPLAGGRGEGQEVAALMRTLGSAKAAQHSAPWVLRAEGTILVGADGSLTPTWGGTSTLIGRYTASAALFVEDNGIDFSGTGTYVAANGDQIDFSYVGKFQNPLGTPGPNPFSGTARFAGGTGRFADAIGFVIYSGVLQEDLSFQFTHDGRLSR